MESIASTRVGLTKDQTNTFFRNYKQMEVLKEMLTQLDLEGIKKVKDLAEYSKDNWKHVAKNLNCPGGRMKNLDKEKDNNNPSMVPQTLYLFGARTQKRLQEALELTRYYYTVGCCLIFANTAYAMVIQSFTNQWAGLKDCKCQTQPVALKITTELPIMR
eukprot:11011271-Ditylum_brightwellii.AAC.1